MDHYDEELYDNLFFQTIQNSFSSILDLVSVSGWMVLVPCKNSLQGVELTLDNIESHVAKAQEDDPNEFYTLNKKELLIRSGVISTGEGFSENRQVKVLFEELFYNTEGGSYRVLCISGPLQGGILEEEQNKEHNAGELLKSKKPKMEVSQLNFEDSCQHLWGYPRGAKIKNYLMRTLDQLTRDLNVGRDVSTEEMIEKVKKTFESLVKFLVKTPPFKKTASHYGMYLALETFIMHRIYRQLMRLIGLHTKDRDTKLNRITRNLTPNIQLEHLGLNISDISSLDRSRIILNNFTRHITPSAKIYQLRKLFYSLLYSLPALDGTFSVMTSNELIPLCAFLIAKSNTNNWWCHLFIMRNFCFSLSHFDQELEYFLSTLEAGMMFLMSEKINPYNVWNEVVLAPLFPYNEPPPLIVLEVFQFVMANNLIGLEDLKLKVERITQGGDPSMKCHPLCSCPRCSGHDLSADVRSMQQALQVYNEAGFTALHVACILGHHDIVDWLLNNGSFVNEKSHLGHQPLHLACMMGFQVLVLLLLSHGADIRSTDENSNSALHIAAFHGHLQCVKALIFIDQATKKLDLNGTNNQLDTPLHIAARWGYEDICVCLLESGASCLKRNKQHLMPSVLAPNLFLCQLIMKAATEETKMEAILRRKHSLAHKDDRIIHAGNSLRPDLEFGLLESLSESSLSTPTSSSFSSSSSSKGGQAWKVKHLNASSPMGRCKSLCSIESADKHNSKQSLTNDNRGNDDDARFNSPLCDQHSTSDVSHSSTLKVIKMSDDEDELIKNLLKACNEGNIDKVKSLLHWSEYEQENPEAALIDITKIKLCHPLCQCNKCIHAQWLSPANQRTSQRISINMTSIEGLSPLHVSCKNGHLELTHLLLMRGASVNCGGASSRGYFPLHLACQQPSHQIVHMLIQYGADLNVLDDLGNSVLHFCSLCHFFKHALLLLLFNADPNKTNMRGHSPLYNALRSSDLKMTFVLVVFGADINMCPNVNMTNQTKCALTESMLIGHSLRTVHHLPPVHNLLETCLKVKRSKSWSCRSSVGGCSRGGTHKLCKESRDDSKIMQSHEAVWHLNTPPN